MRFSFFKPSLEGLEDRLLNSVTPFHFANVEGHYLGGADRAVEVKGTLLDAQNAPVSQGDVWFTGRLGFYPSYEGQTYKATTDQNGNFDAFFFVTQGDPAYSYVVGLQLENGFGDDKVTQEIDLGNDGPYLQAVATRLNSATVSFQGTAVDEFVTGLKVTIQGFLGGEVQATVGSDGTWSATGEIDPTQWTSFQVYCSDELGSYGNMLFYDFAAA